MKYKTKKGLAWRRVGGELYIVDAAGAELRELNGPAALIWEKLAAGADAAELAAALQAEFEVDAGAASADAADFAAELAAEGLLLPAGDKK